MASKEPQPITTSALPRAFGHYYLERRIGAGGMGSVYRAVPWGVPKWCVIKLMQPSLTNDETLIERFKDEAQIMVVVDHDHVVRCFDCGRVGRQYYIAMEYVHGVSLAGFLGAARMRKEQLPLELGLRIAHDTLAALSYIHRARDKGGKPLLLVHRDISPDNILIGFDGSIKVTDFGLSRALRYPGRTKGATALGKYGYMSPEQAKHGQIDGRSDLFSLGCVLFEVFTGQKLVDVSNKNHHEFWKALLNPNHRSPSTIRRDLPPEFDELVLTALRTEIGDRYRNADEMQSVLQNMSLKIAPRSALAFESQRLFPEADFEAPPLPDFSAVNINMDKSVVFAMSIDAARKSLNVNEIPASWSTAETEQYDAGDFRAGLLGSAHGGSPTELLDGGKLIAAMADQPMVDAGDLSDTIVGDPSVTDLTDIPDTHITDHPDIDMTHQPAVDMTHIPDTDITDHPDIDMTHQPATDMTDTEQLAAVDPATIGKPSPAIVGASSHQLRARIVSDSQPTPLVSIPPVEEAPSEEESATAALVPFEHVPTGQFESALKQLGLGSRIGNDPDRNAPAESPGDVPTEPMDHTRKVSRASPSTSSKTWVLVSLGVGITAGAVAWGLHLFLK